MTCRDATVTPTRIFVGCGLGPNYSAAYRLDDGNSGDRIWQTGFGSNPQASAMSPDGTRLIVGGHFGINPIKEQVCGRPWGGLIASSPLTGQADCSRHFGRFTWVTARLLHTPEHQLGETAIHPCACTEAQASSVPKIIHLGDTQV